VLVAGNPLMSVVMDAGQILDDLSPLKRFTMDLSGKFEVRTLNVEQHVERGRLECSDLHFAFPVPGSVRGSAFDVQHFRI
jgi:hypothetical protein